MRVEKVSIRHEYVGPICEELDNKCMAKGDPQIYSMVGPEEYDYELPESKNPYVYLMYNDKDQLIAYLGYVAIDDNNIEMCITVDPDYRRQKIATNLFLRLVAEYETKSFSIAIDPDNTTAKHFLEKIGFTYSSTEAAMQLSKEDFSFDAEPIELKSENYISENDENMIPQTIYPSNTLKITGIVDGEEVGYLYISYAEVCFALFDIEIKENYREMGYGNRLLQTALKDAFKHANTVVLHVSSNNIPAINLYQKIGFKTSQKVDMYEL